MVKRSVEVSQQCFSLGFLPGLAFTTGPCDIAFANLNGNGDKSKNLNIFCIVSALLA